MRLTEYINQFRRYMETSTRLLPGTRKRYAYEIEVFAREMGDGGFRSLTSQRLLEWHTKLYDSGASPGTIQQKHSALRKFLEYVSDFFEEKHAEVLLKALRKLQVPRDRKAKRQAYALEEEEIERILEAAAYKPRIGLRNRAILHFFWATGVRRGELITLKDGGIDLKERQAHVWGKGGKERVVFFSEACRDDLTRWIRERKTWPRRPKVDSFFISTGGGPLDVHAVWSVVKDACARAGIRRVVWTHVFRHSFITSRLERKMTIQEVATIAGHVNINTTALYYHPELHKLRQEYDRAAVPTGARGKENKDDEH